MMMPLKSWQLPSVELPYEQVNPITLEPPIAPHIAARDAGIRITADRLAGYCRGAMLKKSDLTFIEGSRWLAGSFEPQGIFFCFAQSA